MNADFAETVEKSKNPEAPGFPGKKTLITWSTAKRRTTSSSASGMPSIRYETQSVEGPRSRGCFCHEVEGISAEGRRSTKDSRNSKIRSCKDGKAIATRPTPSRREAATTRKAIIPIIPQLSKSDVKRYRSTMSQNVFKDMLQKGYHKSFAALHKLLRIQEEKIYSERHQESLGEWTQSLVKNSVVKLQKIAETFVEVEQEYLNDIKKQMTGRSANSGNHSMTTFSRSGLQAIYNNQPSITITTQTLGQSNHASTTTTQSSSTSEHLNNNVLPVLRMNSDGSLGLFSPGKHVLQSKRTSFYTKKVTIYTALGKHFEENDPDTWLANYFYTEAVSAADSIAGRDQFREAMTRRNLGRILMLQNRFEEAAPCLDQCHLLSVEKPWSTEEGTRFEVDVSSSLAKCHFRIADASVEVQESLTQCQIAKSAADRTRDRQLEALANFKRGQALFRCDRLEESGEDIRAFLDYAAEIPELNDEVTEALEISARILRAEGESSAALLGAQRWAGNALKTRNRKSAYRACIFLGRLCQEAQTPSHLEHASRFLQKADAIARHGLAGADIRRSKVEFGLLLGACLWTTTAALVGGSRRVVDARHVLEWKTDAALDDALCQGVEAATKQDLLRFALNRLDKNETIRNQTEDGDGPESEGNLQDPLDDESEFSELGILAIRNSLDDESEFSEFSKGLF